MECKKSLWAVMVVPLYKKYIIKITVIFIHVQVDKTKHY